MSRKIRHHNVPTDFHAESETEALILEQALAFYREIKAVAENAQPGQVLAQAEAVCLLKGREFVRKSLELTVQEQIDDLEKKRNTRLPNVPNEKTTSRIPEQRHFDRRR